MPSEIPKNMKEHNIISSSGTLITDQKIESILIAQSNTANSQSTPPTAQTPWGLIAFSILAVALLANWLWNHRSKLLNGTQSVLASGKGTVNDPEDIPTREFSVDVTAMSVRTENYLRADIQATVYVSIGREKDSIKKATEFFGEGDKINSQSIANAVTKRAEAAIRGVVGKEELENLHQKREELSKEVEDSLKKGLGRLGLEINEIVIGNIEENENYSSNNYFDAKILEERTEKIQQAIKESRSKKLETDQAISIKKIEVEEAIRKKQFTVEQDSLEDSQTIQIAQLDMEEAIRKKQFTVEQDSLKDSQTIQIAQLDQEQTIETHRLQVQAAIQIEEEKQNSTVEKTKIEQDMELIEQNKNLANKNQELQVLQSTIQKEVETTELTTLIAILKKEQEKLIAEKERAKEEEAVNTAIEEEKADCRHKIAQKAAEAAQEEAKAIEALTEAESKRYQLIPPNDSARMAQIIQQIIKELTPELMEKLPELAKALAPQPGVLGDSNVYTFPNDNGEGVNQLMLSTSGMLLIKTLMEGKFGQILEQAVKSIKDDTNGHSS